MPGPCRLLCNFSPREPALSASLSAQRSHWASVQHHALKALDWGPIGFDNCVIAVSFELHEVLHKEILISSTINLGSTIINAKHPAPMLNLRRCSAAILTRGCREEWRRLVGPQTAMRGSCPFAGHPCRQDGSGQTARIWGRLR